ncbi:interleukin-3 [Trachypithecus francoisi]|uniref:interleukin-3 n=1 Tax=Trachypithecus francoisi TaxID=54180 RepID=UPI00141AFF30|nr:interleukin-3 [Trachypithecus francoisi]
MSRLPILLLLHLLVSPGLQAPMTQTTSLKTSWANCSNMIDEIITHLNQPPLPSPDFNNLNGEDQAILVEKNLRRSNLEAFSRAVKSLQNASAIESILKNLPPCLPMATAAPMRHPIRITNGDWNDFWRKLKFYLKTLENEQAQ